MYSPTITRALPLTSIRRERLLPVPGEVLVQSGDRVEPVQVIARAEVPGRYHIIDVARTLRVPKENADEYVRREPGEPVKAGQIIAVKRGLMARAVRSPVDAVVAAFGGGRVLLEPAGEPIELRAYLPGTVTNVISKKGVLIETTGALIQGRWGTGGESFGVLKVLAPDHTSPLRARSIDIACHGAVLVGGATMDLDALQQAQELQVKGIIIGSLETELIEAAQEAEFPVIATEGLGEAPMAEPIFRLLKTNEGREASINGETKMGWDMKRPEIVIPLPTDTRPAYPSLSDAFLEPGSDVRIVRGPRRGQIGQVKRLAPEAHFVEIGISFQGAILTLQDQTEAFVPVFNLELLG